MVTTLNLIEQAFLFPDASFLFPALGSVKELQRDTSLWAPG
jgi:hypothetical protein